MSVEQDIGQSTLLQEQNNEPVVQEETEPEPQTASLVVEEICGSVEPTSDAIESDPKPQEPPSSDLRMWFESLSNEERLAALGFQDEAFLRTFLSVAPWLRREPTDPEAASYTSGTFLHADASKRGEAG
jgi:hypothetical protein